MKKLFPLILLIVVFAITVSTVLAAGSQEASQPQPSNPETPPVKDVVLSVDVVINVDVLGNRHIQKWQRVIDGVIHVKNDYIRKDIDLDTNEVILHEQRWRDIEFESVGIKPFEPPSGEYFWKRVVLFVDEEDLGFFESGRSFYTFFDVDEYPLVCWEVRYTDGTTVMYDLDGNLIGYGVPAPSSKGYLFSGYDYNWWCWFYPWLCDPWLDWRNNATYQYSTWCDSTTSAFDPTTSQIRSYVNNPNYKFYYAIAHGGSLSCFAKRKNGNETYITASQVYEDMEYRAAMVFAFLGHCDGMVKTNYPSFSDAFRKGLSTCGSNTVTVGYNEIDESEEAWSVSLLWQNSMFNYMGAGQTIWNAYVYAVNNWPDIYGYVKFVGDTCMHLP